MIRDASFTGSGYAAAYSHLLGETQLSGIRLVDSQPSFRAQDIEEVGDNRHTTFLKLGNWSLGDYFKTSLKLEWMFGIPTDIK